MQRPDKAHEAELAERRQCSLSTMQSNVSQVWPLIIAVAVQLANVIGGAECNAQTAEPRAQPPWAYSYREDGPNRIEFMATTAALEDRDVWLLLACSGSRTFSVSIMHDGKYPFSLSDLTGLTLQFDDFQPISLPAAVIEQRQITASSVFTRDLFPVLTHSKILSVLVRGRRGAAHTYTFSLQPNNVALRDIDIHCFESGA